VEAMNCGSGVCEICKGTTGTKSAKTLNGLVNCFLRYRAKCPDEVIKYCKKQKTFAGAIRAAAYSEDETGRMHGHQRRLGHEICRRAAKILLTHQNKLKQCQTFESLYKEIKPELQPLKGVGELFMYDFCTRIGGFLKLAPEGVYMHAGTEVGARALNVKIVKPFVLMKEFKPPIRKLKPAQAEDFLCICKKCIARYTESK
jgi:hypothetical protein